MDMKECSTKIGKGGDNKSPYKTPIFTSENIDTNFISLTKPLI